MAWKPPHVTLLKKEERLGSIKMKKIRARKIRVRNKKQGQEKEREEVLAKKQCKSVSRASSSLTELTSGNIVSDFSSVIEQESSTTPPSAVVSSTGTTDVNSSSPILDTEGESNDSPMSDITGDKDLPLVDITGLTTPSISSSENIERVNSPIQQDSVSPQLNTPSSSFPICTLSSSFSPNSKLQASAHEEAKIVTSDESIILASEEIVNLKSAIEKYHFVTRERESELWDTILSHNPYL